MNKSKRIAIGGWLSKALSIMTRGWFGGETEVLPKPGCIELSYTALYGLVLVTSALCCIELSYGTIYALVFDVQSKHDLILVNNKAYGLSLSKQSAYGVSLSFEAC